MDECGWNGTRWASQGASYKTVATSFFPKVIFCWAAYLSEIKLSGRAICNAYRTKNAWGKHAENEHKSSNLPQLVLNLQLSNRNILHHLLIWIQLTQGLGTWRFGGLYIFSGVSVHDGVLSARRRPTREQARSFCSTLGLRKATK